MEGVHIYDHPLIHHKISYLRDKETRTAQFRDLVEELSLLMAYEVLRDLPTQTVAVETPLAVADCKRVKEDEIIIVPILRAGLGMVSGFQKLLPFVRIGHIGLARNEETHEPEAYYYKMPQGLEAATVIVVDPMLATGGSACDAIDLVKQKGCQDIRLMCLVAAPEGIKMVQEKHPDVDIYVASIDRQLNENCYILPGLGDAGDRIFGTE